MFCDPCRVPHALSDGCSLTYRDPMVHLMTAPRHVVTDVHLMSIMAHSMTDDPPCPS